MDYLDPSDAIAKEFSTSARAAASRTRAALTAYGVFLVLASIAISNVYLLNWNDAIMDQMVLASRLMQRSPRPTPFVEPPAVRQTPAPARAFAASWVDAFNAVPGDTLASRDQLERAAELALRAGWDSSALARQIEYRHAFRQNNILSVPVPLTALRVDVNSFGLLFVSGLLFLLWNLITHLRRELLCLKRVAAQAPLFYEAVALDSAISMCCGRRGQTAVIIGIACPVAFGVWQAAIDWQSLRFGELISVRLAWTVCLGEALGVLACIYFAIAIVHLLRDCNRTLVAAIGVS